MVNRIQDFPDIAKIPIYTGTIFTEEGEEAWGEFNTSSAGVHIKIDPEASFRTLLHEIAHAYTTGIAYLAEVIL